MSLLSTFAQSTNYYSYNTNTSGRWSIGVLFGIILAVFVLWIIVSWKVYVKAGKPGWASIIPIYNIYVLLKIVDRPVWWLILFLIPVINLIISIVLAVDLAKAFGKSTAFGVIGLWLFSFIGYAILAFGDAKYISPSRPESPQQAAA